MAVLVVGAFLLSGCGDDEPSTTSSDSSSTTSSDDRPRSVGYAMGTTDVPAEPERVVVLDSSFLDAALALDVVPVGATEAEVGAGMPDYLAGGARTEELGSELDAHGTHLSMVRFLLPDEIRVYGPETFSGTVLTDVGFDLGHHAWDEYSMAYLSAEQLEQADADLILATSYGGRDNDGFPNAFAAVEPSWNSVPAVAEGRQHWVEDDTWMLGIGPLGAQLILDDLADIRGA